MAGTPVNALDIANDGTLYSQSGNVTSIATGDSGTVYTSTGPGAAPSWVAPTAGGIVTLDTDVGSATGSTVNILAGVSAQTCGSSVQFSGATDTVQLDVTDALTNTIIGKGAGNATLTGSENAVYGSTAGMGLTSGSHNCFVGVAAGSSTTTQSSNIYLNTSGNPEANTLRIGSGTGTGPKELIASYISGINGNTLGGTPKMVTIDTTTDQLGVADVPAGGGITTIDGDSGSATGSTVTIESGVSTLNCGATVKFTNTGSTSTLNVTDSLSNIMIGKTSGNLTMTSGNNIALGENCLNLLTNGSSNIAIGTQSLLNVTDGERNIFIGEGSGDGFSSGSYNIGIGNNSGTSFATSESSNIVINSTGQATDSNTLRIGNATGSAAQELNKAFIAGINGNTVTTPAFVTTDTTTDQMGTVPYIKNGTFTPILVGASTAGTTTYSIQSGFYTQIGNMVFVQGFIDVTAATGTGGILIGNFPVASNSQADGYAIGSIYWDGDNTWPWGSASTTICIQNGPGDNFVYPVVFGSGTSPDFGIVQMGTGHLTVQFSITYTV